MFIKLTLYDDDELHVRSSAILAVMPSEFPNANTAVLIGDNPDGPFNVLETMGEVLAMIREAEAENVFPKLLDAAFEREASLRRPVVVKAEPTHKPVDEDLPIFDKELLRVLQDTYGCRVVVSNNGFHWRVWCCNQVGNYYPTTQRFHIADEEGNSKERFLAVIGEITTPF